MVRKLIVVILLMLTVSCSSAPFQDYEDGTYIGEAQGKRRHLKVEITIENGQMSACSVIEHYEGVYYAKEPVVVIPQRILEKQSTQVDVVSGSTLTSQGIIKAVEDALQKAKK